MAKLDTSTIAGYAEMTPEQKVAALEALTVPDAVDLTQYVSKATFDKKATEAAETSRQLKALKDASLSEEERFKAEKAEFEKEKADFAFRSNGALVRGIFGSAGLKPEKYAGLDIDHFSDESAAKQFADASLFTEVKCFFTCRNGINADVVFVYVYDIVGFTVNMNSVCLAESSQFIYCEFIFKR